VGTGGAGTGGDGTGGAGTGGAGTGGDGTGGAGTGGDGTGGAGTGGDGTGGAGTGGAGTGGAGTGGDGTGGAGTGGDGTGGAGTGGDGTGGAGTGGAGGGGGANVPGAAILSAPFTDASQQTQFQIEFGGPGLDLTGATVTFRICVASGTGDATYLNAYAQGTGQHYQFVSNLSGISACPTLQDVPLTVAGGDLDTTTVRVIGLQMGTSAVATTAALYVDSVAVTGNVAGPYGFDFNSQPFYVNGGGHAGSTVGHTGGSAGSVGSLGVAVLTAPFTDTGQQTQFQINFGGTVDLSGATVTFLMCSAGGTGDATYMNAYAQGTGQNFQGLGNLSGVPACPTLGEFNFVVAGGDLDPTVVRFLGLQMGTFAAATTAVLQVNAITVTGNVAGPYRFAYNSQPFFVNGGGQAGSTVTWTTLLGQLAAR
jgi:hypothetical protein